MSIDGTDFRILDPKPFDSKWFSHKFKAAGMQYEVGLSINCGDIVWHGGGYRAGECNDLGMARLDFVHQLCHGERAIGDKGYNDGKYFVYPKRNMTSLRKWSLKQIMARHEHVNSRFKYYECMNTRFRHGWEKHNNCFEAIVKLTQIKIENGQPLSKVKNMKRLC